MVAYPLMAYRVSSAEQARLLTLPPVLLDGADDGRDLEAGRPPEGALLGIVEVPSIGVHAAVVEGVSDDVLMAAPGHLPGTAPPGEPGVSVISAHRDMQFRDLADVEIGDTVFVRTARGSARYRVTDTDVVLPRTPWVTAPAEGSVLRLVTCWPTWFVGPAPKRLVVSAQLAHRAALATAAPGATATAAPVALTSYVLPGTPIPVTASGTLGATTALLAASWGLRGGRTRLTFAALVAGVALTVASLAVVSFA
jgi:LPXTG-site transpeptidase (sortase) family protein